jgi:hypothetical protein
LPKTAGGILKGIGVAATVINTGTAVLQLQKIRQQKKRPELLFKVLLLEHLLFR